MASDHQKLQEWAEAGFLHALWEKGLTTYDELRGINWEWEATDGTNIEAYLARAPAGPNPMDRGKKNETKYADRWKSRCFQKWSEEGFLDIWALGLMKYDEMAVIAWECQSIENIDGCMIKKTLRWKPLGQIPPIGKKIGRSEMCLWMKNGFHAQLFPME
ncbi:MAG: hypothetical protein LBM75_05165 [Myxococcales bacterium]|jgi:hypothetical protein|nr:hypothetical protein [Myxococcales bacterium]